MSLPNMHLDHIASCLCCTKLCMGYEGDWSDVTPGMGAYCYCAEGHFNHDGDTTLDQQHDIHTRGIFCPDFDGRPA